MIGTRPIVGCAFRGAIGAILVLLCTLQLRAQDTQQLFDQANQAFREAAAQSKQNASSSAELFESAAEAYLRVMQQGGFENGLLHYNAANAFYLAGDLGRSILHYRRAQSMIPGDTNLLINLAQARQQVKNRIELASERQVLKILFFWHYDLPAGVRFKGFVILWSIAWLIAILSLVLKSRTYLKWLAIPAGVLSTVLLLSVVVTERQKQANPAGVITVDEVVARMGPDENAYEPSFKSPLTAGVECTIVENRAGWLRIRLRDGRETWVPQAAVTQV